MTVRYVNIGGSERVSVVPETLFYAVGARIDELKPHFKPETNILCDGKSGIVKATENEGRKATIECDTCHGSVKEEV